MRTLPIGARVRVLDTGPTWARAETGKIAIDLGDDTYLVQFDDPQFDDYGDGPFSGVPLNRADLSTCLD